MIISDGDEWTKNTPQVEFPYIENVYRLFRAGANVENRHFSDEKHDYGPSKRLEAYRFLSKHLGLSLQSVTHEDGSIDESDVRIESREAMLVFTPDHPHPTMPSWGTMLWSWP